MSNLLGVYSRETFKMWYNGVILNRKVDRRDACSTLAAHRRADGVAICTHHFAFPNLLQNCFLTSSRQSRDTALLCGSRKVVKMQRGWMRAKSAVSTTTSQLDCVNKRLVFRPLRLASVFGLFPTASLLTFATGAVGARTKGLSSSVPVVVALAKRAEVVARGDGSGKLLHVESLLVGFVQAAGRFQRRCGTSIGFLSCILPREGCYA